MCGRYVIFSTPETIRALFRYGEQPNFPARYNIAPTQPIPIVRLRDGKPSFALMRWGVLPAWVEEPKTFPLLINARGESVLDKPAFRNAIRRRRCLIPTDGFYEWQAGPASGSKQAFFVRARRGEHGAAAPLAFAGLWETWTGPNGEELDTAAIVTTAANRTLSAIHPRMPAFVAPEDFARWLDCDAVPAEEAATLIKPADEALLDAYPVSAAVNRVVNDSEALIAPVSPTDAAEQAATSARPGKTKKNGRPADAILV